MINVMVIDGKARDYQEAIKCSGQAMQKKGYVLDSFADACIEREKVFPTGLPTAIPVAIPHTDAEHVRQDCVCFLRLEKPVPFVRMDVDQNVDCRLVVNIALNEGKKQVTMLSSLIKLLQDDTLVNACIVKPAEEVKMLLEQKFSF